MGAVGPDQVARLSLTRSVWLIATPPVSCAERRSGTCPPAVHGSRVVSGPGEKYAGNVPILKMPRLAVASLGAVMTLTGCGGSDAREHAAGPVKSGPITHAPGGLRTLVRERMPGGYFSIIGRRYSYLGHTHSALESREQAAGSRLRGGGSGDVSVEPGQHSPLEMIVSQGCVGLHAYALAYAMLRDARNAVIAQAGGTTTRFKKVTIPASFHPDGVLVYALLPPGENDVVTRTPSGRVVYNERWHGREAVSCRRPSSNEGAVEGEIG
jgi:hypothetical protein